MCVCKSVNFSTIPVSFSPLPPCVFVFPLIFGWLCYQTIQTIFSFFVNLWTYMRILDFKLKAIFVVVKKSKSWSLKNVRYGMWDQHLGMGGYQGPPRYIAVVGPNKAYLLGHTYFKRYMLTNNLYPILKSTKLLIFS